MNRKLTLSKDNKMVSGVCGGLGEYFNIDATLIRVIFVLLSFASLGSIIPIYIVCVFIIPKKSIIIDNDVNNIINKNDFNDEKNNQNVDKPNNIKFDYDFNEFDDK